MGEPRSVARIKSLTPVPGLTGIALVTAHPPAEMSNIVPSRMSVFPIVEKRTWSSTGILGCSRHSIMVGPGRVLVGNRLFKEFDGNGVLPHFLHQAQISHVANDAGELRAVIAHDAGAVNDDIIDQPVSRGMQ
jgi:hypothetical protein